MAETEPHYHQPSYLVMSGTGPGQSDTNLVAYNGTTATGGDSLKDDLNVYYEVCCLRGQIVEIVADTIQSGDMAFMIICTALVFLMIQV
jgi:Amt family ammonium transporter